MGARGTWESSRPRVLQVDTTKCRSLEKTGGCRLCCASRMFLRIQYATESLGSAMPGACMLVSLLGCAAGTRDAGNTPSVYAFMCMVHHNLHAGQVLQLRRRCLHRRSPRSADPPRCPLSLKAQALSTAVSTVRRSPGRRRSARRHGRSRSARVLHRQGIPTRPMSHAGVSLPPGRPAWSTCFLPGPQPTPLLAVCRSTRRL